MALPPLIAAQFDSPARDTHPETPIEKWFRLHPGVPIEGWTHAMCAINSQLSDWAYRNGPLNMPEKYQGEDGWWL